jgi:uncharacterized protein (DUF2236 family)
MPHSSTSNDVFSDGSMVRKIFGIWGVSVLIGARSLMLQSLHAVSLAGLLKDTSGMRDPEARARRTQLAMETIYWGTWDEARQITDRIHRIHTHIKGEVGPTGGSVPANTRYDALDERLQQWIIASIIDSGIAVYELFQGRLTEVEKDQFVREYATVASLFRVPASHQWTSYRQFQSYMDSMYATLGQTGGDPYAQLEITAENRELVLKLVMDPGNALVDVPQWHRAVNAVLPPHVREAFGLTCTTIDAQAFSGVFKAAKAGLAMGRAAETAANLWEWGLSINPLTRWMTPGFHVAKETIYGTLHGPIIYRRGYLDTVSCPGDADLTPNIVSQLQKLNRFMPRKLK